MNTDATLKLKAKLTRTKKVFMLVDSNGRPSFVGKYEEIEVPVYPKKMFDAALNDNWVVCAELATKYGFAGIAEQIDALAV